jgi:hypothetical protein
MTPDTTPTATADDLARLDVAELRILPLRTDAAPDQQHQRALDVSACAASLDPRDPALIKRVWEITRALAAEVEIPTGNRLRVLNLEKFLTLEIPPRRPILTPWLDEKTLAMIHSWRGCGKTYLALALGFAIATGRSFLTWKAPQARRVLYLDGEMPAADMQKRLAQMAAVPAADAPEPDPDYFQMLCGDLQESPLGHLDTPEGQSAIEPWVEKADVIIIDSLTTLTSSVRENDAESWLPMQEWLLALRRRNKAAIFLHHDGKGGAQRGTSSKETVLDVVLQLKRPSDYEATQGARFEAHFEKTRGFTGKDAEPIEAALTIDDHARPVWTTRRVTETQRDRGLALLGNGAKVNDVVQELGVDRATVYRWKAAGAESHPSHA